MADSQRESDRMSSDAARYVVLDDDGRLVARITAREGHLRRASTKAQPSLRAVSFADIELLSAAHQALFERLLDASDDLDALLFKLGLEDLHVREGELRLGSHLRRL